MHTYGTPAQKARIDSRAEAARAWLLRTAAKDTEDRVYRLWGLKYAGARPDEIQEAANDLLQTQQLDGGWAQTDKLDSDAYATGSALTAAPGGRSGGQGFGLSAWLALPHQPAENGWLLVREKPQQAVSNLLRDRLPSRQGPVDFDGRQQLGGRRPGFGVAAPGQAGSFKGRPRSSPTGSTTSS